MLDDTRTPPVLGEMNVPPQEIAEARDPEAIRRHIESLAGILEAAVEGALNPDDATAELIEETAEAFKVDEATHDEAVAADVVGIERVGEYPDESDDTRRALDAQPDELLADATEIVEARDELAETKGREAITPRHFVDLWVGTELDPWQLRAESAEANKEIANILHDPRGHIPDLLDAAIRLKRESQAYLIENVRGDFYREKVLPMDREIEVLRAVVPNISVQEIRQLYGSHEEFTRIVDSVMADFARRENIWLTTDVCLALNGLGCTDISEWINHSRGQEASSPDAKRVAENLLTSEAHETVEQLGIRYEYYRRRVEVNNSLDHDLSIAGEMVVEMGVDPDLAADIVRSAQGDRWGGYTQIGLDPALALVSISDKIEKMGVEDIQLLHDEMGLTSFHRYSVEQLRFSKSVIERDPEILERLQGPHTIVGIVDATDDYAGGFAGIEDLAGAEATDGQGLIFEAGTMGGEHTMDSLGRKYATFLSDRGISIETLVIAGHGHQGSRGIAMGGIHLEISPSSTRGEAIDTPGMRELFQLMHENGTIIAFACSQGAVNSEAGRSTAGEMTRLARETGGYAVSYGIAEEGMFYTKPGEGLVANHGNTLVAAYIDDDGVVREWEIEDTPEERYVIRVPALERAVVGV